MALDDDGMQEPDLFTVRSEPGRPIPVDDLAALRLVTTLGDQAARELLQVLQRSDEERAAAIQQLYDREAPMAEALIDIEEDDLTRDRLLVALGRILGE